MLYRIEQHGGSWIGEVYSEIKLYTDDIVFVLDMAYNYSICRAKPFCIKFLRNNQICWSVFENKEDALRHFRPIAG